MRPHFILLAFMAIVVALLQSCDDATSNDRRAGEFDGGTAPSIKAQGPPAAEPKRVLKVRILAKQYEWCIQYPGKDGKLGDLDATKRNPLGEYHEIFGLDRTGAGKDDVITGWFVLPAKTKVIAQFTSIDVPHHLIMHASDLDQRIPNEGISTVTFQVDSLGTFVEDDRRDMYVFAFYNLDSLDIERVQFTHRGFPIHCGVQCGVGANLHKNTLYVLPSDRFKEYEQLLYSLHPAGFTEMEQ